VTPTPAVISSSTGSVVTLTCLASHSPSICLWRTPYKAIYTVGGGRIWEEGRLTSSLLAESRQCGLTIDKLETRDGGVWQCEVGSVVDGDFTTTTASTTVTVTEFSESTRPNRNLKLLRLLGEETILPCSVGSISSPGRRSLDIKTEKLCLWTTPYNRTYRMTNMKKEGEFRGREIKIVICVWQVFSPGTRACGYVKSATRELITYKQNKFTSNLKVP
jgi:hypothetical protein